MNGLEMNPVFSLTLEEYHLYWVIPLILGTPAALIILYAILVFVTEDLKRKPWKTRFPHLFEDETEIQGTEELDFNWMEEGF